MILPSIPCVQIIITNLSVQLPIHDLCFLIKSLLEIDRSTRKMMTMNGGLYPRSLVHKLYVAGGTGDRGLIGWEDCVWSEEWCEKDEGELL